MRPDRNTVAIVILIASLVGCSTREKITMDQPFPNNDDVEIATAISVTRRPPNVTTDSRGYVVEPEHDDRGYFVPSETEDEQRSREAWQSTLPSNK